MIKKMIGTLMLLGFIALSFGQAADLFFSEYVEGASNNKAIEIYNGTGAAVDMSQYTIKLASNGNEWSATNILTPPAGTMLANGDVYVIANSSAITAIIDVSDVTSTVTYFNGNDALGLFHGTTQIDAIGVYQTDPGTAWDVAGTTAATLNHTLIRKPSVTQGNLNWTVSAGSNMDNSEWIVHPQDYIANLGSHQFGGGGNNAATPTFNPPAGVYSGTINVTLASTTPGAQIRYTTNGTDPTETSTLYSAPIAISANTTLKARAYASGYDPSYVATAAYTFPVMVNNIAALRAAAADGTTVYHLAGEVFLTFQQSFRHQKFVQDHTGAILIDDYNGVITTTYAVADGITGITGTLNRYTTGMLQFWPSMNSAPATSTGNVIPTPTVTLADINSNIEFYQAKLVHIDAVHFNSPTGNFANGTSYDLSDATGTLLFRTQFYDVDYIGTPMPVGNFNLRAIVQQYNDLNQITARFQADFNPPVANDDEVGVPAATRLIGNYPNPFNPSTTISFEQTKAAPAQITVYNLKGQAVKHFELGNADKGLNKVTWNGTDDSGQPVSNGVYYFRLKSGSYTSTKKMVLMK